MDYIGLQLLDDVNLVFLDYGMPRGEALDVRAFEDDFHKFC